MHTQLGEPVSAQATVLSPLVSERYARYDAVLHGQHMTLTEWLDDVMRRAGLPAVAKDSHGRWSGAMVYSEWAAAHAALDAAEKAAATGAAVVEIGSVPMVTRAPKTARDGYKIARPFRGATHRLIGGRTYKLVMLGATCRAGYKIARPYKVAA